MAGHWFNTSKTRKKNVRKAGYSDLRILTLTPLMVWFNCTVWNPALIGSQSKFYHLFKCKFNWLQGSFPSLVSVCVYIYIPILETNYISKFCKIDPFAFWFWQYSFSAPNLCPNWYALRNYTTYTSLAYVPKQQERRKIPR